MVRQTHASTRTAAAARSALGGRLLLCTVGASAVLVLALAIGLGQVADLRAADGERALLAAMLTVISAGTVLVCGYLTLIWALAATVVYLDRSGRPAPGAAAALRLFAPGLARRVATTTVLASACAGLPIGPASASPPAPDPHPAVAVRAGVGSGADLLEGHVRDTAAQHAVHVPVDAVASAHLSGGDRPGVVGRTEFRVPVEHPRTPGPVPNPEPEHPVPDMPPLGWGTPISPQRPTEPVGPRSHAHQHHRSQREKSPRHPTSPRHSNLPQRTSHRRQFHHDRGQRSHAHIVTVHRGDTLWQITDDLLGPGHHSAARIARTWPVLYRANRGVIGDDPDLIEPGQRLVVPSELEETP